MIHGKNIILRTINPDEIDLIYELIVHINKKGRFWHLNIPSAKEFDNEYNRTGFWSVEEGRMLITTTQHEYVGEILYFKGLDYQSGYEVGYELFHPSYAGKGYMTEALLLFCGYLFACYPINRIQVNAMRENISSCKVAEKCGFKYEGTMRKATYHDGKYHDLNLFSLLREECPPLSNLLG